ncbi:MAG: hypothetical protein JJ992_18785, partial [Planctomycetes bacterium]|nr:hypothetical protein [Planctomycetota bacterium]
GAAPNDPRAAQLCDKSVRLRPDVPWFQLASAIAAYRSERFGEALGRLEAADALAGDQLYCRVMIDLFRAMSQQRSGAREAARDSLEKALSRLNTTATTDVNGSVDYGASWHDRLMCEVIHREAASLIDDGNEP